MRPTKGFNETVMARVKKDPAFRTELIVESTNAFLTGDMETGKALLLDYLNATESVAAQRTHLCGILHLVPKIFLTHKRRLNIFRPAKGSFYQYYQFILTETNIKRSAKKHPPAG